MVTDNEKTENETPEIEPLASAPVESEGAVPDLVALEPLEPLEAVPQDSDALSTLPSEEEESVAVDEIEEPVSESASDESVISGGAAELAETDYAGGALETADAFADDASDDVEVDEDEAEGEPPVKRGKHAAPEGMKGNSAQLGVIGAGEPGYVASFGEIPAKKRHRGLKAFGITVGVLAAVLLVAYIAGAIVFMGRMFPNTTIGDFDVSMKSDAEVAEMLESAVAGYQLDVLGGGFSYRTTADEIGLSIDTSAILDAVHEDLNPWTWPVLVFQPGHDEGDLLEVSYRQSNYEPEVTDEVNKFNESATPPTNATILYDDKKSKFVVEPEKAGTQLNAEAVLATMSTAIDKLEPKARLSEDELVQPTVFSDDEKLIEAAELASGMVSADLTLVMDGKPVADVNGETLSSFITIDDNLQVIFREDEMNAWVSDLADGFNTIGTERSYTRADGKEITVPAGGSYGWEIDTEELMNAVLEGIKSGAAAKIEVPCIDTAAVYNGPGGRDWGNRYIDVDLSEQHVRFYGDDGSLIWETDCISGSPDGTHNTVPGTWYVNSKESPSKLIGYENGKKIYETSVTYWMPFEGNGIGFHDATWQPSFGGSMYANGYGSHGCVNLSYSAAESLYGIVEVGDPVVVHY